MSWDTLEPTEYGLVQNGFTGAVDLRPTAVYEGGRYFIWLVRAADPRPPPHGAWATARAHPPSLTPCCHLRSATTFWSSRAICARSNSTREAAAARPFPLVQGAPLAGCAVSTAHRPTARPR
jgi:hypothetical protein